MANNIVTNADDVDIILESDGEKHGTPNSMGRFNANEFTLTVDQDITSEGMVGQNTPAGLSKGDLEYSFSFTVVGQDTTMMDMVSDDTGDSLPFSMTARKVDGGETQWEYSIETCLADTEEITGTSGETLEVSVEGLGAGFDKEVSA